MEAMYDDTYDQLTLNMSKVPLSTIPWRTAKNNLITLNLDSSIRNALETLSSGNVLSAPVFDEFGTFQGFCDYQQLVRMVVRMCRNEPKPGILTQDYFEKSSQLRNTTIRDLIAGRTSAGFVYGEYAYPINESSSLYQAFERLAREGQHRLAIQEPSGRIAGIMCQSQVIKYMCDHMNKLGSAKDLLVSELRPYAFISTINENSRALRAFEVMDSKRISLNGVAVTNNQGTLVDVISTSDLRGILPGTFEFNKLWSSVKDFKASVRNKNPDIRTLPVSVKRTDTLEKVIKKMANNKVHRVFVVNSAQAPIDVISQTDILRHILDSEAVTWW